MRILKFMITWHKTLLLFILYIRHKFRDLENSYHIHPERIIYVKQRGMLNIIPKDSCWIYRVYFKKKTTDNISCCAWVVYLVMCMIYSSLTFSCLIYIRNLRFNSKLEYILTYYLIYLHVIKLKFAIQLIWYSIFKNCGCYDKSDINYLLNNMSIFMISLLNTTRWQSKIWVNH